MKTGDPTTDPVDVGVRHWLELSAYDVDTADAMLRAGRYLYVGFMCHQSVEKALKACYQRREHRVPPRTHNLLVLASVTGLLGRMSGDHKDLLTELEPLAVEARYPEHKARMRELLDRGLGESILERRREILGWIQSELSK